MTGYPKHADPSPCTQLNWKQSLLLAVVGMAPGLLILGVALIAVAAVDEVTLPSMLMDPAAFGGELPTAGAVSLAGSLLWAAAATAAFIGAAALSSVDRRSALFLAGWGFLSTMLCLDDTYQLHEAVIPAVTGIPEEVTYAFYALCFAGLVIGFRDVMRRTPRVLFAVVVVLLAASIAFDAVQPWFPGQMRLLAEDGFKLLAISGWTTWTITTVLLAVRRHLVTLPKEEPHR